MFGYRVKQKYLAPEKMLLISGSMNGSVWEHVLDGEMLVDVRQMECNEPPVETTTAEEGQKKVIRFVRLTVTSTFAGSPSLFYMGFDHEPAPMETDFIQLQLPKIKEMSAFSAAGNYHLSLYSVSDLNCSRYNILQLHSTYARIPLSRIIWERPKIR